MSIVTVEELLEGASDEAAAVASVQRFPIQGLHLAQARRCARLQHRARRRLGENDAWLVATAESIDADVVGADRIAFERLGGAIPALSVKRNDCARAPGGSRIPAAFRGRTEYLRITRRSSYPTAKSD